MLDLERLASLVQDYDRGLDRRTRRRNVAVENDSYHYFCVIDVETREKLMCGFDTSSHAHCWAMLRGYMPVQSDETVLLKLNLMALCEGQKQ